MRALLLVDIQNDFMPFGALPVAHGDQVVDVANGLMPAFDFVVASQDWHPLDHGSFARNHPGHSPGQVIELAGLEQVLWPDHCVQNTPGASFHSGLDVASIDAVVRKGSDPSIDSYSAFFDNAHRKDTGLDRLLRSAAVTEIVMLGLATDYCVLATALDARELGLMVTVVRDGVRAVDLNAGDGDAALETMRSAGCVLAMSDELSGGRY